VVFLSFLALAFLLSFGRVFYLQVIKGEKFAAAAVAQRTAAFVYDSGRGDILDREGRKLHSREVKQVYGPETMIGSFSRFPAGGLNVMSEIRYSEDSLASHVTGYIKKPRSPLQPQDGICGLERTFNQELWGMPAAMWMPKRKWFRVLVF
jgi:cell division protein FtsI/penicillin-binding protein 2